MGASLHACNRVSSLHQLLQTQSMMRDQNTIRSTIQTTDRTQSHCDGLRATEDVTAQGFQGSRFLHCALPLPGTSCSLRLRRAPSCAASCLLSTYSAWPSQKRGWPIDGGCMGDAERTWNRIKFLINDPRIGYSPDSGDVHVRGPELEIREFRI